MRSAVQSCDPLRKTSTCDSPQVLFSICYSVDVIFPRCFSRHVRTKTFSAHVTPEIRHVVSKTGVSAHVKIRPERFRGYVLMCVRPFHTLAHGKSAGRSYASTHFLHPTGSCVDMPRHGSAQSWVIRMPGFIRRQESKRLSSSGRGEPFPTAPRRPGGR